MSGNVKSYGKWDYKNNLQGGVDRGLFTSDLLQEFGNYHFGIISNSYGFNLESSMYGAGAYQVLFQEGGSDFALSQATVLMEFTGGGYLLPDFVSRGMTKLGFTWGDNSGDSISIMQGWDYANGL